MEDSLEESKDSANGGISWLMHMRLVLSEIERLIREIDRLDRERKELIKDNNCDHTSLQDKLDQKIINLRQEMTDNVKELHDDIAKIKEAVLTMSIKIAIATFLGSLILTALAQVVFKKWIG
jgi:phage host-nuclease inhibitor protein Gam